MWMAALLVPLLLAAHLVPRTQLPPLVGIGLWWSILALRLAVAVCVALVVLFYLPASQLFDLLTRWCLHAVLPFLAAHFGLSGRRLGDAASLVPAVGLVVSVGSALVESWWVRREVRRWLWRSSLGPGPQDSVVVGDPRLIVSVAGMRDARVVVSAAALARLDAAELAAGLQHEWGHVRRFHWLVALSSSLLLSVSRFLPGGRRAYRNLQFHLERDADQYAVRSTGDRLALASAICKVAAGRSVPAHGGTSFGLHGTGTSDRLRLLLSDDDFRGRRMASLLGAVMTLGALALTIALLAAVPAVAEGGIQMAGGATAIVLCA